MSQLPSAVSFLGLSTIVLAMGCQTPIDSPKVQDAIKSTAAQGGLTLTSVTCPTGQVAKEGGSFKCTVTDDQGTSGTYTVTMTDDKGTVNMKPDLPVGDLKSLSDAIEPKLTASAGSPVNITCPTKAFFLKKGLKFECEATKGDEKGKVALTTTDDSGAFDAVFEKA